MYDCIQYPAFSSLHITDLHISIMPCRTLKPSHWDGCLWCYITVHMLTHDWHHKIGSVPGTIGVHENCGEWMPRVAMWQQATVRVHHSSLFLKVVLQEYPFHPLGFIPCLTGERNMSGKGWNIYTDAFLYMFIFSLGEMKIWTCTQMHLLLLLSFLEK